MILAAQKKFFQLTGNLNKNDAKRRGKSVRIQSYSGLHFPAFGLNTNANAE